MWAISKLQKYFTKRLTWMPYLILRAVCAPAQEQPTLNPCNSQICVTNKIRPEDLIRKTPEELTRLSKERYKMGDFTCENITFYRFKKENSDQLVIDFGKRLGTLIKIDRENDCDDHKESEAVPIEFDGKEEYAVTGFNGSPVLLDRTFFIIVTADTFWCKGLPAEPSRYHTCKLCGKTYSTQLFRAKDKIDGTLRDQDYYESGGCQKSTTGNHDNLVKGKNIPCGIRGKSY